MLDNATNDPPQPDTAMAAAFLARLDGHPNAPWYFQSYDDREERIERFRQAAKKAEADALAAGKNPDEVKAAAEAAGKDRNIQTFPGTFAQVRERLLLLNADGYAIAVGINASDGGGRHKENIYAARAVFADLDGVPLELALKLLAEHDLVPHLIVRSSPGKWHLYMLINGGCPLDTYEKTQESVAIMLGSDRKVIGRQTVMRLPGFVHHKHAPVLSVVESASDHAKYDHSAFDSLLKAHPPKPKQKAKAKKGEADPTILEALERARLVRPGARRDGGVNLRCPWRDEHSQETGDSSTTYWPHWPTPDDGPFFKCLHDHCDGRGIGALCVWLAGQDKTFAKARKAWWQQQQQREPYRHVNADATYWQELKPRHDYRIEHFRAHVPDGKYICMTDSKPWLEKKLAKLLSPVGLFNADGSAIMKPVEKAGEEPEQVVISATTWLDTFKPVGGVVWWPGLPPIIDHRGMDQAGMWVDHRGAHLYNEYRPSRIAGGKPREGERWADFVRELFPNGSDGERLIRYAAYCRQHPEGKINHALLLIGEQGVGKDTSLAAIRSGLGEHNWRTVKPGDLTKDFNPWLKCVGLQVNESREDEAFNKFRYYDAMKDPITTPPDMIGCNEKYRPHVWVRKPTGVFINSNYELDAVWLPRDDRRIDVLLSPRLKGWKDKSFFVNLFDWFEQRHGYAHVAAWLDSYDNSAFEPKAEPFCSDAKRVIINTGRPAQEGQLADALEWLLNPLVVTIAMIREVTLHHTEDRAFLEWLDDQANFSALPHRFHDNGYVLLDNPERADGRWRIDSKRQTVYGLKSAAKADVLAAARALVIRGQAGVMGAIQQERERREAMAGMASNE